MQGSGAGDASCGERPTQFYLRFLDKAEDGHPFVNRHFLSVISGHAMCSVMLCDSAPSPALRW